MTRTGRTARRFRAVAVTAPIALTGVAVLMQLLAIPVLPDPVAVHWNAAGQPDGFGPVWMPAAVTAAVGLLMPLIIAGAARLQSTVDPRWESRGASYRFLGATSLGTTAFVVVMITVATLMQIGLDDATAAPSIWVPLLAAGLVALIACVIAWRLLPATVARPAATAAEPLPLGRTEEVVWVRTTRVGRVGVAVLFGSSALVLGLGIWLLLVEGGAGAAITLGCGVLVTVLAITSVAYRVVVDARGLTVRAFSGLPRFHVPAADIRSAEAVVVDPMLDFGGWGWRWRPGRFGVVTRAGGAVSVLRTNGREFVVTVDDAGTAASLLVAVAARAHQKG
ncbi:DUF1648 domain-containing protein [Microbacterium sp. NPDC056044]|uniref:DUF1648 domain-containing protein n=1 Tax=Microbacterium sp. NPDC056044 TaxID=3345690 RepID=UPI0035DD7A21